MIDLYKAFIAPVIPAQAGIHPCKLPSATTDGWTPAFAGVTNIGEASK